MTEEARLFIANQQLIDEKYSQRPQERTKQHVKGDSEMFKIVADRTITILSI